jgi:hypothetical protein
VRFENEKLKLKKWFMKFNNRNHFLKVMKLFWCNQKDFRFDYYFRSHQTSNNTKNTFLKIFYVKLKHSRFFVNLLGVVAMEPHGNQNVTFEYIYTYTTYPIVKLHIYK